MSEFTQDGPLDQVRKGNEVLEMRDYLNELSWDFKHGPELKNTFKMPPLLSRGKTKRPTTEQVLWDMNNSW